MINGLVEKVAFAQIGNNVESGITEWDERAVQEGVQVYMYMYLYIP